MDGFSKINTLNFLEKNEIKIDDFSSKNDAYNKIKRESYMNKKDAIN